MNPLETLAWARAKYARDWSEGDAELLEEGGHYLWMRSFLVGYDRIVEAGCGDGRSTYALLQGGHSVVAIDENPACILAASTWLDLNGYPTFAINREELSTDGAKYYSAYTAIANAVWPEPETAVLATGHLFADPNTDELLRSLAPVDGIACWLMGSHGAVSNNGRTPGDQTQHMYRLRVQNHLYELADEVLRPGGILHIVDRYDPVAPDMVEEALAGHREQAGPTSLRIESHETRHYHRPHRANQITMARAGRPIADQDFTLLSVTARKPAAS